MVKGALIRSFPGSGRLLAGLAHPLCATWRHSLRLWEFWLRLLLGQFRLPGHL